MFRLKLSKFGLISQFHRQMLPLITRKYCQRKNGKVKLIYVETLSEISRAP